MKPERDEISRFRSIFPRLAKCVEQCEKQDLNKVEMTLYDRIMLKAHMPLSEHSPFWLGRIEMVKRHFNARNLEELNNRLERIAVGIEDMLRSEGE